jgi:hypothetical protein
MGGREVSCRPWVFRIEGRERTQLEVPPNRRHYQLQCNIVGLALRVILSPREHHVGVRRFEMPASTERRRQHSSPTLSLLTPGQRGVPILKPNPLSPSHNSHLDAAVEDSPSDQREKGGRDEHRAERERTNEDCRRGDQKGRIASFLLDVGSARGRAGHGARTNSGGGRHVTRSA